MEGVGRNNPCPCGSGKKFKKCCMGKYPRELVVSIGFNKPFNGVSPDNGQAYVHTLPGEKVKADYVSSQVQYTGKTGKIKVISLIHNKVTLDINKSLATDFDYIFAIDTNTNKLDNDSISISSIFQCNANIIGNRVKCRWHKIINICFKNTSSKESERIGWAKLVKFIASNNKYDDLRIAIITDHDRNRHAMYKNRELPIFGDIYLPSNITIIYAASDKGSGNIMNKLLVDCDNDANRCFNQLSGDGFIVDDNTKITVDQLPDVKDNKHIIVIYR